MNGQRSSLSDRGFLAVAGILMIGAFLLRVYQLDTQELWLDEAFSVHMATLPSGLGEAFRIEHNPPLYYLLLRAWIPLAGTSEAAVRLLSAIFGTLFVPAAIWAGSVLFNRRVGVWAGAFATIAPIHIYYSQEARAYALLVLLLMLASVLLWRALLLQTRAAWVLATTLGILALYTHYLAILAILPTTFMVFLPQHRRQAKQNWHRLGAATVVCGMACVPLLYWLWSSPTIRVEKFSWIQLLWKQTPPVLAIPKTLEVFGLGSQTGLVNLLIKVYPNVLFPSWLRVLGIVLLVMLGLWVAIPWKDQTLQIHHLRKRKIWLWTMLCFPLTALWLASLYHPLYVVGRYDMIAFPAFTLLVGLALAKLQGAGRAGSLLVCCVALVFAGLVGTKLVQYYQAPPGPVRGTPSARITAGALLSIVRNGDLVVFTGLRGLPILYYFSQAGFVWAGGNCENQQSDRHFGCRMFPIETEKAPATFPSTPFHTVREDLQSILSTLSEDGGVIWIVFAAGTYSEGQLHLPNLDSLLVQELQHMGFQFTPTEAPGVFAFPPLMQLSERSEEGLHQQGVLNMAPR